MKPYLKHIILLFAAVCIALVIGFVAQYYFDTKLYVPLIIGSMVPVCMSWQKNRNANVKQ